MSGQIDYEPLPLFRDRTTTHTIRWEDGEDVSGDTFAAELRAGPTSSADLLATLTVGTAEAASGRLSITMDDSQWGSISADVHEGWFDLKRTIGGEPTTVFEQSIKCEFVEMTTA